MSSRVFLQIGYQIFFVDESCKKLLSSERRGFYCDKRMCFVSKIFVTGRFGHSVQTPVNWCLSTNCHRLSRNKCKNWYMCCEKRIFRLLLCWGAGEAFGSVTISGFFSKMTLGKSLWLPVPA